MGARVAQPASGEVVRAERLRSALESGAPPAFVSRETTPGGNGLLWKNGENTEARSHLLEQIFGTAPDGMAIVDRFDRTLCVNDAFQTMFGYAAADLLGLSIDALIVPVERQAESRWLSECVGRGEAVTVETQRKRKDGRWIEVSITKTPLLSEGRIAGHSALYRDITEQKQAATLKSAMYRVAEKTGAAKDLQQFFAAVHGIVDELMYARNFYIALHDPATDTLSFPYFVDEQDAAPEPKKAARGLTEHVLRTGEPLLATPEVLRQMEERGDVRRSDWQRIGTQSLDWMGVPLKAGERTFGALVVQTYSPNIRYREQDKEVLTFVSRQLASAIEHKKNEQALRRSEARYRSLVESSAYGIYRSSLEGKFLDLNPALMTMLGYESSQEILGLDPKADVFMNAHQYVRLLEEFQRSGRVDGMEVKWKRKNGSAITVRISGRTVSNPDEPSDVLEAIAEDITERRALEEQFRQAQKMEAVGRLAGGVAHDFNNLLMVIGGYAEVILEGLAQEHPLYGKARAIQQASDRATTMTRQLLAFSRRQLLELKVVNVNTIVDDMERLLRPLIGENIELVADLAADAGRTRADAGQLEQVLMNLVVNAKDAMPNGGRIAIKTENITLDDLSRGDNTFIRPGEYVALSVTDNGHGMNKETQLRIFEPFFTTKEKGKGTGLGLSTVYGIVKQTGGYLMVHSDPGCGSTFSIYLPRVEDSADNRSCAAAARVPAGGSETVLLVEDEESVRQLVRDTLQLKGYLVLEAENGSAGLAAAAAHAGTINLVISDVIMPGLSGHELVQQLLKSRPDIKVLYLSGYTEDAIVSEGTIEGGKAFLQKPFTLQNLARKVREVLG